MKSYSELKEDLLNSILFMQQSLDANYYSDEDVKDIQDRIIGLYQTIDILNNL